MRRDLSTKIISLLFAIFMWFYIIQVQNPEIEKTIRDIPVQFTKSELEGRGLTLINDKEMQLTIKIRGPRKHISNVKKEDITVVADVTKIDSTGTHNVSANVILPYGNVEVVEQKPSHLTVTVDEIVEAEKEVIVKNIGEPRDGYWLSEYKVTPDKVKIKGPKTIVSTIEQLAAEVDVKGKNEDVTAADVPLNFIGTSGEAFNSPYVTLGKETVDVHCTISKLKEVEIDVRFADGVNNESEHYVLDESSIKTIEIAGSTDATDKIEKISTEKITHAMISSSGEVEVTLSLPEGILSRDGNRVTLKLKKITSR